MSRMLKHVEIREYVRELVRGSSPGTAAPSERDLVDRFGVARMTVRQALDALVAEGVLERYPGRGTFVAEPRRMPTGVSSFTEDMAAKGVVAESRTLVAERVAPNASVAGALRLRSDEMVVHWRRLRLADGHPVCLSDAFLPESMVPGLLEKLPPSLYVDLASRGRRPTWAEDDVAARTASDVEAGLLEIPVGGVVLRRARRALWRDVPVEVSRTIYRGDQHSVCLLLRD
ncbi:MULTISPECIES: GntR family transcriptional regulator [unclassified Nocardioides]|uniref:GntR family transcriptional regulator n=1 Tax=unclassified Nocardioides TaxID=2615069 RepID=UPI0006FA03A1|nr:MULTISPECIES: GntR family transcriptional regulator [unclassified Nocardioides]KRA38468.1 GntR family transcriptional regulator [Nocardioides sp. Root614]KRA92428.1 GntR family transcriptional regulator [Nocardioides sp. Root682]